MSRSRNRLLAFLGLLGFLWVSIWLPAQRPRFRNHRPAPVLSMPDHHNLPPLRSHQHRRHHS